MTYAMTKLDSNNQAISITSPFPFESVHPLIFRGYPEVFDSSKYFHCSFNTSRSSNGSTSTWATYDMSFIHCPAIFDEDEMDYDYVDLTSNISNTNNSQVRVYIKTDSNGLMTALKVNDEILIGSGFIGDSDWKMVSSTLVRTEIGYNNHIPVICFTNQLSSYIYLVSYFVKTGETKLTFRILDLSYASDSETQFWCPSAAAGGFVKINEINEVMYFYIQQTRDNLLVTNLFDNARFVIR